MADEPAITINGVNLSIGQAMSVRLAVISFRNDMLKPAALGADEIGRTLASGYAEALTGVIDIMTRRRD